MAGTSDRPETITSCRIVARTCLLTKLPVSRLLPSPVPELQAEEKHRLLHPADVHAFDPHHHPLLGVLLDQLRCLCCQSGIRWGSYSHVIHFQIVEDEKVSRSGCDQRQISTPAEHVRLVIYLRSDLRAFLYFLLPLYYVKSAYPVRFVLNF